MDLNSEQCSSGPRKTTAVKRLTGGKAVSKSVAKGSTGGKVSTGGKSSDKGQNKKGSKGTTVLGSKIVKNKRETKRNISRKRERLCNRMYKFSQRWCVSAMVVFGIEESSNILVAGSGFLLGKLKGDHPSQVTFFPPQVMGNYTPSIQVMEHLVMSDSILKEEIVEEKDEEPPLAENNTRSDQDNEWSTHCLDSLLEENLDWRKIESYREGLAKLRRHVRAGLPLEEGDVHKIQIIVEKLIVEDARAIFSLFLETVWEIMKVKQDAVQIERILPRLLFLVESEKVNKQDRNRILQLLEQIKTSYQPQEILDALMEMVDNNAEAHEKVSILAYLRAVIKMDVTIKFSVEYKLQLIIQWIGGANKKVAKSAADTIWTIANKDRSLLEISEPFKSQAYSSLGIRNPLGDAPSGQVEAQSDKDRGETSQINGLPAKKLKLSTKKKKAFEVPHAMPPPSSVKHKLVKNNNSKNNLF